MIFLLLRDITDLPVNGVHVQNRPFRHIILISFFVEQGIERANIYDN